MTGANEWQPIETAPKDGTLVLVYGEPAGEMSGPYGENHIFPAQWTDKTDFPGYDWTIPSTDYAAMWIKPTHWVPLPEPPKEGV